MESGITLFHALVTASVPPDKAKALVLALKKEMGRRLESSQDQPCLNQDLSLLKQELLVAQQRFEERLTLRTAAMMATAVVVIVALLKLL